jgi:hypothetical protein
MVAAGLYLGSSSLALTNLNYPEFKHKRCSKEALSRVDGWSNPVWVKEELVAMSERHTHLADSSSLKIWNGKPHQHYTMYLFFLRDMAPFFCQGRGVIAGLLDQ